MGGLFGGGGSSQQAVAPPTPSLAPEATSVSRAEVSDGEAAVSRMYEKERKRRGYASTMRSGGSSASAAVSSAASGKKQKLGE